MERPIDAPASQWGSGPHQGGQLEASAECEAQSRLRRQGEEKLSQRLYSIILAVHAAENSLLKDPARLSAILELIHKQSAASLEDLRRLGALR